MIEPGTCFFVPDIPTEHMEQGRCRHPKARPAIPKRNFPKETRRSSLENSVPLPVLIYFSADPVQRADFLFMDFDCKE